MSGRTSGTFMRVRALLAGALVLGIGATATVAAWTDVERAQSTITAGTFGVEARSSGSSTWSDYTTTPAVLGLDSSTRWFPGQTRAAWIEMRAKAGSLGGTVTLTSVTNGTSSTIPSGSAGELWRSLRVKIVPMTAGASCTASTPGTEHPLSTLPSNLERPLPAGTASTAGSAARYCVVVRMPNEATSLAQGGSITPRWSFTASTPAS